MIMDFIVRFSKDKLLIWIYINVQLFAVIALGFSNLLIGYTFTNVAYMDDKDGTKLESVLGELQRFELFPSLQ